MNTAAEVAEWAKPYITKVGNICLPDYAIEFNKIQNPQEDEESKDEVDPIIRMVTAVKEYKALVESVQAHLNSQISKIESQLSV